MSKKLPNARKKKRTGCAVPDSSPRVVSHRVPTLENDRPQDTELALRKYIEHNADSVLKKLVEENCNENALIHYLWVIPRTSGQKMPLAARMSFQDLLELPEQMIDLAEKLERVNNSLLIGPNTFTSIAEAFEASGISTQDLPFPRNVVYAKGMEFAPVFRSLPSRLRLYGEYLREELSIQKRFNLFSRHGVRLQTLATLMLLKLVKDSTGRFYYESIATLLELAYYHAGQHRSIAPDDLRKLNDNNPFLKAALNPSLLGLAKKPATVGKKQRPHRAR